MGIEILNMSVRTAKTNIDKGKGIQIVGFGTRQRGVGSDIAGMHICVVSIVDIGIEGGGIVNM